MKKRIHINYTNTDTNLRGHDIRNTRRLISVGCALTLLLTSLWGVTRSLPLLLFIFLSFFHLGNHPTIPFMLLGYWSLHRFFVVLFKLSCNMWVWIIRCTVSQTFPPNPRWCPRLFDLDACSFGISMHTVLCIGTLNVFFLVRVRISVIKRLHNNVMLRGQQQVRVVPLSEVFAKINQWSKLMYILYGNDLIISRLGIWPNVTPI